MNIVRTLSGKVNIEDDGIIVRQGIRELEVFFFSG